MKYIACVLILTFFTACNPMGKASKLDSTLLPVAAQVAPAVQNQTINLNEGATTTSKLIATDRNGDKLTYSITSSPSKGTATLNSSSTGSFTYVAQSGVTGSDSFTFSVTDGTRVTVGTVTINFTDSSTPDVPTAFLISTTPASSNIVTIGVNCNSDFDGISFTESSTAPTSGGGTWFTCATTFNVTMTTTIGNKTLYVWSKDANGNVSATAAAVVVKLIPIANFASTTLAKNETDGTAALIINLSAASTSTITIPVTYIGTATATTDYTAPSTVTFNPGDISKTLTITLVNDTAAEGDETIITILGNSSEHVVGTTDSATVTISDPEDFPVLTANDLTVTEGAVAEATISLAHSYILNAI